ncbi:uncharacterized protein LOC108916759 [Anoplophora glabripennis]|uniref:uncharacterized protein LOC108915492 n=1 Tax=Anoplophora glabripennis TaxID=217634 RepID=UPI0008745E4C|nr:uncharacterized protein LOC108915492 [Anoplophora glabripennis]XP_018578570.1 uncharacterized protein LOC108916759 [Anoplophora glabripennis]
MPKKFCLPNCKVQRDDPDGLDLSFYIVQVSSSKEAPVSDDVELSLIDPNVQESNDSSISEVTSSKVTTIRSSSMHKKSLSNIDMDSIPFTMENLPMIRRILLNRQNEVIALKRKLQESVPAHASEIWKRIILFS